MHGAGGHIHGRIQLACGSGWRDDGAPPRSRGGLACPSRPAEPACGPCGPKARAARLPFGIETMRRIHLLQGWSALPEPAMEEALHDTPACRGFAELGDRVTRPTR